MTTQITNMTPLLPEDAEALQDLALTVIQKSAALGNRQHPVTLRSIQELLRIVNSYYSNLIEGHNTHPYDIVRAMQRQYDAEPAKRNLQKESVAHITVQSDMENRLREEPETNVASREFLCYLHREFYSHLPGEFRIAKEPETGRECQVIPGTLRSVTVKVGRHLPPESESLERLLGRFGEVYAPNKHYGATKLVALAAAHHRLMWIHPFLDGNGRVARLFTEAYFQRIPVDGYGLWSVSRGLARKNIDYKEALTWADAPRRNDLDGRGYLSNEGLIRFCRFFLEVCLDQVEYMGSMLRLEELVRRIRYYVDSRVSRLIPGPSSGKQLLRPEASRMLQEVMVHGVSTRGELIQASGLKERTGRNLLGQLLEEKLLVSDSPKGDVKLGFPIHAAGWYFPDLYPNITK